MSSLFALMLWFVGAAIFVQTEYKQHWTYFQSLYFAYVSLMTIGYGGETTPVERLNHLLTVVRFRPEIEQWQGLLRLLVSAGHPIFDHLDL